MKSFVAMLIVLACMLISLGRTAMWAADSIDDIPGDPDFSDWVEAVLPSLDNLLLLS